MENDEYRLLEERMRLDHIASRRDAEMLSRRPISEQLKSIKKEQLEPKGITIDEKDVGEILLSGHLLDTLDFKDCDFTCSKELFQRMIELPSLNLLYLDSCSFAFIIDNSIFHNLQSLRRFFLCRPRTPVVLTDEFLDVLRTKSVEFRFTDCLTNFTLNGVLRHVKKFPKKLYDFGFIRCTNEELLRFKPMFEEATGHIAKIYTENWRNYTKLANPIVLKFGDHKLELDIIEEN